MKTRLACLVLAALALSPARAQEQARGAAPVSAEFVEMFSSWCLQGFPSDEAMVAQAARKRAHAMSDRQLGEFLYMGKGRGWAMAGRDGNYIVTDEQRPWRACTLRRYSDALYSTDPMLAAVKRFTTAKGRSLAPPKRDDRAITPRVHSYDVSYAELDARGRPTGARYTFELLSYGVGQDALGRSLVGFWEMRFTHRISGRTI